MAEINDQLLFNLLDEMQHDAEKAQEKTQLGKARYTVKHLQWVDKTKSPTELDFETWQKLNDEERRIKFVFSVDIQEFNPSLEFTYSREVLMGGTDWFKITWPSLKAMTGEKELSAALAKLANAYVEVSDVLQAPTKKNPNPEYRTVKFVKLFSSRDECYAAWAERFGKTGETAPTAGNPAIEIPEGGVWDASTWPAMYDSFVTACSEANGKPEAVRKVLADKIVKDYSVSANYVSKFITPF